VHVIGTTGIDEAGEAKIRAAARHARIVKSGNMSLGVTLLAALVRKAAAALGEDFDIEVLEMHHRHKIDAPSGTALLLGNAAAEGRGLDLKSRSIRSRDGHTGARPQGDIGFATLRGGSVVGEHTVMFAGPAERIEFTHKAESRDIFARGAVRAARWAMDKKRSHSMADVLGLEDDGTPAGARPPRTERMEFSEPVHRLEGSGPHREGRDGGDCGGQAAQGQGAFLRYRLYQRADAGPAHARSHSRRARPDGT
jgi:hypothetical protein